MQTIASRASARKSSPRTAAYAREVRRGLRAAAVAAMQREAKARAFKTPMPWDPTVPAAGTIGWVRRQGNALVLWLSEQGLTAATMLVAVVMANASNEAGETRLGQRRIATLTGLSLRTVGTAWAELRAVGFFAPAFDVGAKGVTTVPDYYRKKRRAGTYHALRMPTHEQLSLVYAPLAPEQERQQALPFVPPAEPPPVDAPAAPARPASPPHVGGESCPCRPCRAAAEALPRPEENIAREASQSETLSGTGERARVEAVTSGEAEAPTADAASAAIDAAHDVGRLTTAELASARAIDREIDRRGRERHALPRTPQVPGRGIEPPPPPRAPSTARASAFARSIVTEYVDGRKVRRVDTARLSSFFVEPARREPEPEHLESRANREPTDPE